MAVFVSFSKLCLAALAFVQLQAESFPLLWLVDDIECYILEVASIEDNAGGSGWNILLFSMNDDS